MIVDDSLQNMFVYQPILNDYVTGWKSKDLFESKLLLLHGSFLPNIKYFEYKITLL